jgi:hypothetical protein
VKKRKGLTLKEHIAWGKELVTMRERLVTLTVEISNAYGVKAGDTANKCLKAIDALRSLLDNHVFTEQPGRDTRENIHVYYPGTDSYCGTQAADIIQNAQTAVGQLRDRYNQHQREFWALAVAWEAVRFAWYVVTGNLDTARNKLDLVKTAVTDFERMDAL